ncbi:MAG: 4-hydroxy-3-methylbut-2-enyl diphosphate reductase [Bacteroidales bacterium]|nr:MAG: 4-hydroxy-3-methylbut-2-enyl diphosphate reductase [Bacteroidales bacterium]
MMNIEIDPRSGFCFGVVNAINQAEKELQNADDLYCLGDIVHNSEEVSRLESKGLITIDHKSLGNLKGKKVLLRAHGEPPETYRIAKDNGIQIIDATCPVVLKLQSKIKRSWEEIKTSGGQIVIYGKKGHAEVNGLVGQTEGNAIVIETPEQLTAIDFTKPIALFSQTTMSPDKYLQLADNIRRLMVEAKGCEDVLLTINRTICGQVSNRKKEVVQFAQKHQVIIFVSGEKSSNGKMLYEICKEANANTYLVMNPNSIVKDWFVGYDDVGVCGATSTPVWLMEMVAERIRAVVS